MGVVLLHIIKTVSCTDTECNWIRKKDVEEKEIQSKYSFVVFINVT